MLPVIYNPINEVYKPPVEILQGSQLKSHDNPDRINKVKEHLHKKEIIELIDVKYECDFETLSQVHCSKYLMFLKRISESLAEDSFIIPDTFPCRGKPSNIPTDIEAQVGYYCFDTFTSFISITYQAAALAAACAIEGAKYLSSHSLVYALCRPPGHHAQSDLAGGYCFLNNAAIASKYLHSLFDYKVAILDLDFHHGNGTQEIFYDSRDILTVSLHGDPRTNYPYFSGYVEEIGIGIGKGFNHNFPLGDGATGEDYLKVLNKSLNQINKFQPDVLVISLGFDTHKDDPIGTFHLTKDCYFSISSEIIKLETPILLVQEGGYALMHLGDSAHAFLSGLLV